MRSRYYYIENYIEHNIIKNEELLFVGFDNRNPLFENLINVLNKTNSLRDFEYKEEEIKRSQKIECEDAEDEIKEMQLLNESLSDVKNDLINTSKLVKDEWMVIDEKLSLYELEKKEFLTNFPLKIQELYDELKTRGVDVVAAYKLENNQCGCCGVDLTTSELDAISATEFQQCPYCDGVLV